MTTNTQKTAVTKARVVKGKENVTWDEATFTWDQGVNSTWEGVGSITTGNVAKSAVTKTVLNKSSIS